MRKVVVERRREKQSSDLEFLIPRSWVGDACLVGRLSTGWEGGGSWKRRSRKVEGRIRPRRPREVRIAWFDYDLESLKRRRCKVLRRRSRRLPRWKRSRRFGGVRFEGGRKRWKLRIDEEELGGRWDSLLRRGCEGRSRGCGGESESRRGSGSKVRKGRELVRKDRKWELNPFDRRFRVGDDVVREEEDPSHLRYQRERSAFSQEEARRLKERERAKRREGKTRLTFRTLPLNVLNTHSPPKQIIIRQGLPILRDLNRHS